MNNNMDKWVLPQVADWNTTEHRNCFLIFEAEKQEWCLWKISQLPSLPIPSMRCHCKVGFSLQKPESVLLNNSSLQKLRYKTNSSSAAVGFNFQSLLDEYNCDFSHKQKLERLLRALMLFAHFAALCAESELAKLCFKCAFPAWQGSNSAWNILPQTFVFTCLTQRQDFLWLICGFAMCTSHWAIHYGRRIKEVSALSPTLAFPVWQC